ncbi:hypothetical protein BKA63DRAFT_118059 [Paraphoma chrysanthemicola]|nr:hypothetical protein BKA63DRAFT_118059 [Paraphoma chrysanthemicola]
MPAGLPIPPHVRPRFPQAPYPLSNGTNVAPPTTTTTTSRQIPAATRSPTNNNAQATSEEPTPSSIPSPSLAPVTVVPVGQLPPPTTTYSSIPQYTTSSAKILQGHCADPNYTILDGPTAYWVPVVGCISSKAECCPTPMTSGEAPAPTNTKQDDQNNKKPNGGAGGGRAAFPISSMPSQGQIKGCPQDYHTVTAANGTACCPSSYWLWSTELGGQVPCYSSLKKDLVPPPMPDTLAFGDSLTSSSRDGAFSDTITLAAFPRPTAPTNPSKPTSAIVNIAYAMQYQLAEEDTPAVLKKESKIGIGVGAAAGGLLLLGLIAFLVRRVMKRKRTKVGGYEDNSASQRFGSGIDMSRVAHEPAGVARTHGGVKYTGVSMRALDH